MAIKTQSRNRYHGLHLFALHQTNTEKSYEKFTPRLLPKVPVPAQACNLQHCKNKVYAKTTLVTVQELETLFNAKMNGFTVNGDQSTSIGLCREHYQLIYTFCTM